MIIATALVLSASAASAQTISQRGFVEGQFFAVPKEVPNDTARSIADVLFREEVFVKPAQWFQFAAGLDLRGNTHHQVEDEWRLDFKDQSVLRPRAAVRRLTATFIARGFSLDVGKQFIRWGRADIVNPTDRFAPRDYINVLNTDFLPVMAARASLQIGSETFEAVWVPELTPSRIPLITQRWAVRPPGAAGISIVDRGSEIPSGSQQGVRWSHAGGRLESSLSFFDGFNHLPHFDVRMTSPATAALTRVHPALRTYGADLAVPTGWFTLKGEAAYFTSPSATTDEYVLYVVEIERQVGEWLLDAGYAGEAITTARGGFAFAPDRGVTRSIIGRASYTVDPRRTVTIESAVRQTGEGYYLKGEYSQVWGQHWRMTATGVGLGGEADDFLGQFRLNSHGAIALRFSF